MGDCFGVLFPSGSLPSVFGSWAFTKGHRVSLYRPDGIPKYIFTDLSVQAIERSRLRNEPNNALTKLTEPDFTNCNYLTVPKLDVLAKKNDIDYAHLCMNTFR